MIILPAIDLINGNCIRLIKGDFNQVKKYSTDPLSVAKSFEEAGSKWIHIIDLDGAKTGTNKNLSVIKDIVENTSLNVQVGGGIREENDIKTLLDLGVTRIILGTYVIEKLDEIESLTARYPSQIIASIDSLDGTVMYKGWQEKSKRSTIEFAKTLEEKGIKTIVYTDISKDGLLQGPSFNDYTLLQKETSLEVIASGGVSTLEDVIELNNMDMYGAIIGKALYEKKLDLKEVISCLQEE